MTGGRNQQLERAIRWQQHLPQRFVYRVRTTTGLVAFLALAIGLVRFSGEILAVFFFATGVFLAASAWRRFFEWYKNPPLEAELAVVAASLREPTPDQIFPLFDFNARNILHRLEAAGRLTPSDILRAIGTSHLMTFFFIRTGISREDFIRAATPAVPDAPLDEGGKAALFQKALDVAVRSRHSAIRPVDLFRVIAEGTPGLGNLLRGAGLTLDDLEAIYYWEVARLAHRRRHWTQHLGFRRGIGTGWAYGYTPTIDRLAQELKVSSRLEALHVEVHEKEVRELENALSKSTAANAVLVGEPGVGAQTTVLGLAARLNEGRSVRGLNYHRVMKLNMDLLLSQRRDLILEFLGKILREAESAGNIILVIEAIHLYLTPGATEPNVVEVLLPYLRSAPVHFIGLTTPEGFRRAVLENSLIASLFERIDIREPDQETTVRILEDYLTHREANLPLVVRYQAIVTAVELAARYIPDRHFPEKGIGLLEDLLIAMSRLPGKRIVFPEDVEEFVRTRLAVPVGTPQESEKVALLNLEAAIHSRVVDQEEAVSAVANALRRARAGVGSREKPIGTFLFLGPTGVGKTETAKAVSRTYFGATTAMIRLDMTEYQKPDAIDRLIGSPDGREIGQLATGVRERPFSLLLLDEIEKAHPTVLDLFLQILDEGRATDVFGRRIDFRNTIIIGTSNAGAEYIREALIARLDYEMLRQSLVEEVLRAGTFKPEFLNRFDAVVVFKPLDRESVRHVVAILLQELRLRLAEENYLFQPAAELVDWVAARGYSETFGGRELRRFIQDRIESVLARHILAGRYQKGAPIMLRPEDLGS